MKRCIFNTHDKSDLAMLVLRLVAGVVFMAHGSQKLFGWFGGGGLTGTGHWMASIGLEPGIVMAFMAGSGEFFGGLFLIIGLLTRPAALITAFTMVIAMFVVHWPNGFFMSSNGVEFSLTLLIVSLAISLQGAGKFSVDFHLQQKI